MRTGFVGWRGMVGSVLLERMRAEGDFEGLEASFFSTSSPGGPGPDVGGGATTLGDASDVEALRRLDVLVSCQGSGYTHEVVPPLRAAGWNGVFIDASSALRMDGGSCIVLDPVNEEAVRRAVRDGVRTFVGGNCTVSLLLMGLTGLLRSGHVRWVSTMTYQAASGAGARHVRELVAQMRHIGDAAAPVLDDPAAAVLDLDRRVAASLVDGLPTSRFGAPLAASALPWIGAAVADGQTQEEWKAMAEANKMLGRSHDPLPIDGICVRIGALRCHAQAVTLQLDADIPIDEIAGWIADAHPWVEVVPNTAEATLARLTPAAVAGTLQVPVGRLRKMKLGPTFVTAFTVGDQLLWGAAEPLRRMLGILREEGRG